jgi:hypothetical protein
MSSIYDAQIPAARWAGPEDSKWDIYYNDYELWLNENYDMKAQKIAGHFISWEDACESEDLLDEFIEWWTDRSE